MVDSIASIAAADWNRLAGDDPLLRHEFLHPLHETGCASVKSGWAPQFLLLREQEKLTGAMPLYLKSHSYGEYVFDWAWADAYQRHGLAYYPKLLSAVPFTPVTGSRMLADTAARREMLAGAALELAREMHASSLHCLYPGLEQANELNGCGLLLRHGVQFHWRNNDYADFDSFLATFNHDKRKKIKQERRRVRDAGIVFEWFEGPAITDALWIFFNRCYRETYRQHHSTPYLNLEFFRALGRGMAENLVLIVGNRDGNPIAASLNIHNGKRLCGRYWGALEYHPSLHFEACYYQVIEFCIAKRIAVFEGGAQGEHKIARGLMPVETHSAHWLAHPQFAAAIEDFLQRESRGVEIYLDELNERSPFRQNDSSSSAQ
ncbi:MAG: family N-acetyltransferase [Betaproteobacteria bacterium]|nr:family N-acetyltransferase [Betaproteobacteria bacterium]